MKTFFKILFAPLFWLFSSCSPLGEPVDKEKSLNHYYNSSKSDINYSPQGNWFNLGNSPMNADVESFEILTRFFSRDKNNLYFMQHAVKKGEIDVATFYTKKDDFMIYMAFDKNHVYAFEKQYSSEKVFAKFQIIENADPKTYLHSSHDFAKDDKNHFYDGQLISVDYASFKNLNEYFSRDKNKVYYHYFPNNFGFLTSADLHSFKLSASKHIAMDDTHVFGKYSDDKNPQIQTIKKSKEDTVTTLDYNYLQIGSQVYFQASPLDLDPSSLQLFKGNYSKDKTKVYYRDQLLKGADATSFGLMGQYDRDIGDKDGIFEDGERLKK